MQTEIELIVQMFPNGITTPDEAAQTMAALTMHGYNWHWDDDPRDVFGEESEKLQQSLAEVSHALWKTANAFFAILDDPMWDGLVGDFDPYTGFYSYNTGIEPNSTTYVATTYIEGETGKIIITTLEECLEQFEANRSYGFDDDNFAPGSQTMLADWVNKQKPWLPLRLITTQN